jgi:hypothetical protein
LFSLTDSLIIISCTAIPRLLVARSNDPGRSRSSGKVTVPKLV